jgi:branched-chain amino acid transport system permease protein
MEYLLHLAILIVIYVILAQSLSLTAGFAGLISLSQAGFYGLGAYTSAILSVNYHLSFLLTLPIAMLVCGLIAFFISVIALRTVEDYFIICTLAIQIIIFSLMNNWMKLTNGPLGIPGIPTIEIFGIDFGNKLLFLLLTVTLASLVYYFLLKITQSSYGRILKALSEDEIFTMAMGKNVFLAKVLSFTISAIIAAIPGVLYAYYISFIDPTSFTIDESIFILSIVIIGGMRNLWGISLATIVLVLIPEILRFVGLPSNVSANLRQIIYGILLILVVINRTIGIKEFFKSFSKVKYF